MDAHAITRLIRPQVLALRLCNVEFSCNARDVATQEGIPLITSYLTRGAVCKHPVRRAAAKVTFCRGRDASAVAWDTGRHGGGSPSCARDRRSIQNVSNITLDAAHCAALNCAIASFKCRVLATYQLVTFVFCCCRAEDNTAARCIRGRVSFFARLCNSCGSTATPVSVFRERQGTTVWRTRHSICEKTIRAQRLLATSCEPGITFQRAHFAMPQNAVNWTVPKRATCGS